MRKGGGKVMAPGSRGGSFYTTASGNIRYGKPPAGRAAGAAGPAARPVAGGGAGGGAAAPKAAAVKTVKAPKPKTPAPKVDHLPGVKRHAVAVSAAKADLASARAQLKSKDKAVVARAKARVVDAKTRMEQSSDALKSARKVNREHIKSTAQTPVASQLAAKASRKGSRAKKFDPSLEAAIGRIKAVKEPTAFSTIAAMLGIEPSGKKGRR